jgi:hypothetical protein
MLTQHVFRERRSRCGALRDARQCGRLHSARGRRTLGEIGHSITLGRPSLLIVNRFSTMWQYSATHWRQRTSFDDSGERMRVRPRRTLVRSVPVRAETPREFGEIPNVASLIHNSERRLCTGGHGRPSLPPIRDDTQNRQICALRCIACIRSHLG